MIVRPIIYLLSTIAFQLSLLQAAGQLYYRAETITSRDGLSDNRVTCFLKDRDGFIWVGTKNGLNQYDRHSFTIFRPSRKNSISSEAINDIVQDDQGIIWVATMQGLNRYDPKTGHWESIGPEGPEQNNDLPSFIVWDLMIVGNKLWIASDVHEFSEYDPVTRKFNYFDWPAFARKDSHLSSLGYRSIKKFTKRNKDSFWLATTGGLVSLNTSTGDFQFVAGNGNLEINDIAYDTIARKVYVSINNRELLIFDELLNTFNSIYLEAQPFPSTHFKDAGNEKFWMGSKEGLVHIAGFPESFYFSEAIPGLSASLLPGGVNVVFRDQTGITWVGTNNGINKFTNDYRQTAFLPLLDASGKEEINKVNSVFYDPVSSDYFACTGNSSKVFIVHNGSGRIQSLNRDSDGKTFSVCNAVIGDRSNNVWLLTDRQVYKYNRESGQFVLFRIEGVSRDVRFKDMTEDYEGNLWFAGFDGGIVFYNIMEQRLMPVADPLIGRIRNTTAVHSDSIRKKIWIGTFSDGLYCYDQQQKKTIAYYSTDSTPQYAPLSLVHDISQDSHGGIWVATHSGGIFRFLDGRSYGESLQQFSMKDGLCSNNFISICPDNDTTLWVLTGQGMAAMSINGKFLFRVEDRNSFYFPSDGSDDVLPHFIGYNKNKRQVFLGMGSGMLFLSASPGNIRNDYPVKITRVIIGDEEVADSVLVFSYPAIPYRHNTISFDFVALEYSYPGIVKYEYRLVGFDEKWINAGGLHSAKYQNLPPGRYIFQVRARDEAGNLSLSTDQFSFRIAPPFWRTSWFIAIAALLIAGLFYTWISYLRQKIKEQKILNYFATSLYGQNTVDDVFWDVAKNCISQLRFEDCIIYQYDDKRKVLVQKAAFGAKNPSMQQILNPIEIPLGKGIVGAVALTLKPEIVSNTSRDARYIIDDKRRYSEISVPILVDGKIFGVIDSEHPRKSFYKHRHLKLLQKIAETCGIKISRYLVEERLRLKIARDLHDEMGSTLTSINIMSKVAMQQTGDATGIHTQLKKIKEHSSRMMESMSDMVWAIDPSNDSFERIVLRMKEFAGELLEPAGINYFFREEGSIQKIQLNPEQRKDIYLIFKEALNNAVKYSNATEINILLKQETDMIRMVIIDNGIGFDKNNVHLGNGLRNMQSRAQTINGVLRLDSIPGTGTTVSLLIPIP